MELEGLRLLDSKNVELLKWDAKCLTLPNQFLKRLRLFNVIISLQTFSNLVAVPIDAKMINYVLPFLVLSWRKKRFHAYLWYWLWIEGILASWTMSVLVAPRERFYSLLWMYVEPEAVDALNVFQWQAVDVTTWAVAQFLHQRTLCKLIKCAFIEYVSPF